MELPKKSLDQKTQGRLGSPDILCITNRRIFSSVFFSFLARPTKQANKKATNRSPRTHTPSFSVSFRRPSLFDALRFFSQYTTMGVLCHLSAWGVGQLEMAFRMSVWVVHGMTWT